MTQVDARQGLLDQVRCTYPAEGIGEGLKAQIEMVEYCGNVQIVSMGAVRANPLPNPKTTTTISEPTSPPSAKPTINESTLSPTKPPAAVFV